MGFTVAYVLTAWRYITLFDFTLVFDKVHYTLINIVLHSVLGLDCLECYDIKHICIQVKKKNKKYYELK